MDIIQIIIYAYHSEYSLSCFWFIIFMVSELSSGNMENGNAYGSSLNASPANSSLLVANQKVSFVTFHHPISVKLDEKKYLVWRQQTLVAICGHALEKFIEEGAERPNEYATTEDELAGKINEEFLAWKWQDQLLLSWLLSSMSESMLTRIFVSYRSSSV